MNFSFPNTHFNQHKIELPNIIITALVLLFTIVFLTSKLILSGLDELKKLYINFIKTKSNNIEERINNIEKTATDSIEKIYSILLEQKTELTSIVEEINMYKKNVQEDYKHQSPEDLTQCVDCDLMTKNVRD